MWLPCVLLLTSAAPAPGAEALRLPAVTVDGTDDAIVAAGGDAAKLVALGQAWVEEGSDDAARRAFEAALKVDPDNEAAHRGVGHHLHDGTWYTTYAALAKARRDEARKRLAKDGTVRFGDEWVPKEDLPFRRMGWEQLEDGTWAEPGTAARLADEAKKTADGWQLQHRTWVHPDEFDDWRKGLFKVGDDWLTLEEANKAHAEIGKWWEVPGEHFVALSTVSEEDTRWVLWWADQTHAELARIFGLEPKSKPEFVVLNGIVQYNDFAAGSAADQRVPADASGYSSLHYAFFTDGWTEAGAAGGTPRFRGTGACYYDSQDAGLAPFGQHAIRHAAALAWLEAVDPSWGAVSSMLTSPTGGFPDRSFWSEKRVPRWLRYGAAAYCERFFEDKKVAENGDPMWARKWAIENLKSGGALDPLEVVLAMELSTADPASSLRLVHEAGLLVHFLVDGSDRKVRKAWEGYRDVLVSGGDVAEALAELEGVLGKSGKAFSSFAGV